MTHPREPGDSDPDWSLTPGDGSIERFLDPEAGTLERFENAVVKLDAYANVETTKGVEIMFGDEDALVNPDSVGIEVACNSIDVRGRSTETSGTTYHLSVAAFINGQILEKGSESEQLGPDQEAEFTKALAYVKRGVDKESRRRDWLDEALAAVILEGRAQKSDKIEQLLDSVPEPDKPVEQERRYLDGQKFGNGTEISASWKASDTGLQVQAETVEKIKFDYTRADDRASLEISRDDSQSADERPPLMLQYEGIIAQSEWADVMEAIDPTNPDRPTEASMGWFVEVLEQALASGEKRTGSTEPIPLEQLVGEWALDGVPEPEDGDSDQSEDDDPHDQST